jgi:PAS domain S-box-containing protein
MTNDGVRRTSRALAQPVTYLGLAMLAFVYCALAYLLIADRDEAGRSAERRAANIARIFEQSFSHIFKSVDATLLFLRKSYLQDPAGFDLDGWSHDPTVRNALTFNYSIVDASGRLVQTNHGKGLIGTDQSHHEHFRVHAGAGGADRLFIGKPLVLRLSGRQAIFLTRAIIAPDGRFAGVIAAMLDPSQLAREVGQVELGPGGSFALTGFDGVVRTRMVDGATDWPSIGRDVSASAGVLRALKQARAGVFWNEPGVFDNVSRLIVYRALESFPMVAAVTLAESEVYRHADRKAGIYWAVALLLTIAILAAIALGAWREQKLIDTTDAMQQTQLALHQSQERYRLLESAVYDGIWDLNMVTGEAYRSPRWKTMLGCGQDEMIDNAAFFERVHPDDHARIAAAMNAHINEEKPYAVEFRIRCQNGEYLWMQGRGKVLFDAERRPVRMLGTMTDITARKQAEALLEESRNNLARAEEMASLGHYKHVVGSSTFTWSDGVYRIMGKSRATFTPTPSTILELVHPDDRATLEGQHADARAGREPAPVTVRIVRDDGEIRYVESTATATRAADGTLVALFGALQDVTCRKRVQDALARANQELERRVAERTAELAQEMRRREEAQMTLAQMQKMEAVGQLTAGIAHDFNNLLAVIGGGLEFIEQAAARGLTADPDLIDAAFRATRRGRDLVQRLLAFSRQTPLSAEPILIDQLVLDTLRLLQRTLGEGIDIVTRLDATAAAVCVDRNQLANALLNLALNARDAMPAGGVLSIATRRQPARWAAEEGAARWPTGEEVCIIVSDTGCGMTEEVRKRAFEPFFTTKQDGLGSGLGLSIVHGFVEQSGGHIEIESEAGRGTSVTIRLPRIAADRRAEEQPPAAVAAEGGEERTVLLVEDDPDVRIVTAAQLKQLGYKVHAVATGAEAIDLIESPAEIDVTLTDIVLPGGLDGVALLKEAIRARPGMGVVCMSGYSPTQEHRKWLKVQNIEFLEKPFSSNRLAQALEALLMR